ncbi:serine/threonine protein kinase [Penicillium herquei]|nr:serine/threonine protein kinase [Penicillium herquei]
MLGVEDESILVDFEEAEISNPSPRKAVDGRVIYASRDLGIPKIHGRPILSDFGETRFSSTLGKRWEDVQPLAWDLFEQGHLFYARDSNGQVSDSHHLARMIAIMGPPPKEMLQASEYAVKFFNSDGDWKGAAEIPCTSLEKLERNLQGTQQISFLCFMRKMLQWQPKNRASAKELLADPWLKSI